MTEDKQGSKPSPYSVSPAQIELLGRLCNASAVSGNEGEVRRIVLEELRPYVEDIKVDALGNVLITRRGEGPNRLRVMLAAHMDEVGFMLISDEEDGVYRFETVGGVQVQYLPGKLVRVGREHVPGIIGVKPSHLTKPEERKSQVSVDSLRIDVGPGNAKKVKVGDWAVFGTTFAQVGISLRAKALDDRLGVATLLELVKASPPNIDLLAAFTVQEEVGLRGATVASYTLDPDLAFVLDCAPAYDLPSWDGSENTRYNTRPGAGPAIYVADRATVSDPRLVKHLVETAQRANLPTQFRQPGRGGTDAGAIHKQRLGIPSVSVSVPGRYLHTPVSLARLSDWENTLALLFAALESLSPDILTEDR